MKLKHIAYSMAVAAGVMAFSAQSYAADTDSRIESAAKNSYTFKTTLKDDSISVNAKDGVVTLKGKVADEFHRSLAEDTVEVLPGVTRVDNQITLKGERLTERSDAWIATKVRSTLLFHKNVKVSKTNVSVKDGLVVLNGEAENEAQKELTTAYAKDVEGVKDVKNLMIVINGSGSGDTTLSEKIDDASITAHVKMSLASHRSTSALRTKVQTMDGVVSISGVAKNAAEKDLVGKLVEEINGVKKVVNNMTIGM